MNTEIAVPVLTLLGVVVGASLTEIYARRRENEAERRLLERDRLAHQRDRQLAAIEQTKQYMSAVLTRTLATAGGDPSAKDIPIGAHVHPRADLYLVADASVMTQYLLLSATLGRMDPANGVTMEQTAEVASVLNLVDATLNRQEERVEAGQLMLRLDPADLREDLAAEIAGLLQTQSTGPQ